jgi:hypothetical protein
MSAPIAVNAAEPSSSRDARSIRSGRAGPLDVVHPQLFLKVSSDPEWRKRDVDRLEQKIQETRAELRAIQEFESLAFLSVDPPHGGRRETRELTFPDWHSQQGRTE